MRTNIWTLLSRQFVMILVTLTFACVGTGGIRSLQPESETEEGKSPALARLFEEVVHPRTVQSPWVHVRQDTQILCPQSTSRPDRAVKPLPAFDLVLEKAPRAPPPPPRAPPGATA